MWIRISSYYVENCNRYILHHYIFLFIKWTLKANPMLLPTQTAKMSTILSSLFFSSNKWLNASDCEWCMISLSLSLSLVFVLFCNAYLSPSSYSHILPHNVRVLVVLHNLLICDKCLCLGCNNLLFFPQGSSIMILF